jgi:hypothetical protein
MSKKGKEYEKRLKFIREDVLRLSKCLPDIDYDESMYDWETINRTISDMEVASNLKEYECLSWKTKFDIPTHDSQTGELNPHYEELTGEKNPLTNQIEKINPPLTFTKSEIIKDKKMGCDMRVVNDYVNRGHEDLSTKKRIKSIDKSIVEVVWVSDLYHIASSDLYSGCYIQRWYHYKPMLRLMTTNGVVTIKNGC